jgi:hypothetical protein
MNNDTSSTNVQSVYQDPHAQRTVGVIGVKARPNVISVDKASSRLMMIGKIVRRRLRRMIMDDSG